MAVIKRDIFNFESTNNGEGKPVEFTKEYLEEQRLIQEERNKQYLLGKKQFQEACDLLEGKQMLQKIERYLTSQGKQMVIIDL